MNTTRYTLDLAAGLTQVLADGTHTYLYGNGRIAEYTGTTPAYFLADALGSVRQLTDASGSVTLMKSYQPYGETLGSVGGGSSMYGFTGEQTDSTGLVYLRARYYGPAWSGFMTRDVWEGDATQPMSYIPWLFVYSNPINYTDPTGMVSEPPPYPIFHTIGLEISQPAGITFFPSDDPFDEGASGIPRAQRGAQYLNSNKEWTEGTCTSPSDGGSDYCNLCGQVSVAAILRNLANATIDVQDVMSEYEALGYNNYSTSWAEGIGNLMSQSYSRYLKDVKYHWKWWIEAGLENNTGSWRWVNSGENGTHQENLRRVNRMMRRLFTNQQYPMASVMINSEGFIDTPYWGYSMTGHWVVLTGISNEFDLDDGHPMVYDGGTPQLFWQWRWVRVYNPFDNQTEYYPFQHFLDSWIANDNGGILYSLTHRSWPGPSRKCNFFFR